MVTNQGEEAQKLSEERRSRWISAISRDDLTEEILENDRVCEKHFVSGRAAKSWDKFNIDWVPTLLLGHNKATDREHVSPFVAYKSQNLTTFQEFVMTLIKLKLDAPHQDLSYRFNVSLSTVSRIFSSWMVALDVRLAPLINSPEREDLWRTMPQCFKYSFGNKTTVIIDCFEVFINRPSNLLARAQTWSSYKHHNTVKVLIGITPQGTIS